MTSKRIVTFYWGNELLNIKKLNIINNNNPSSVPISNVHNVIGEWIQSILVDNT